MNSLVPTLGPKLRRDSTQNHSKQHYDDCDDLVLRRWSGRTYQLRSVPPRTRTCRTPLPERHTHIRNLPFPFSSSLSLSSRLFLSLLSFSLNLRTCRPVLRILGSRQTCSYSDDVAELTEGEPPPLDDQGSAAPGRSGRASQQPDQGSVRQNEVCCSKQQACREDVHDLHTVEGLLLGESVEHATSATQARVVRPAHQHLSDPNKHASTQVIPQRAHCCSKRRGL